MPSAAHYPPRPSGTAQGAAAPALPRPFQAAARAAPRLLALWSTPAVLALLFALAIVLWAQRNDDIERNELRKSIVADTLSVEAQLRARLDIEKARLRVVAARLPARSLDGNAVLATLPEVAGGLDRLWLGLTWLDANNRLLGQARSQRQAGQTLHLEAPVGDGGAQRWGRLIARYDPADLLRDRNFWWLASQYDVELISGMGQVLASTAKSGRPAGGDSNEKVFESIEDATLRLTRLEPMRPWYRSERTLALLAALVLLSAAATLLLRREVAHVAQAELDWRTEAAWREAMEESALVGLRARDPQGRILYVNRTLCAMVGYTQQELIGLAPPLPFWPPDEVSEMMARNLSTLAGQAPLTGFEARWRHRDGRLLDVMIFESPLMDSTGSPIGWMGSIVDITERRRLEDTERRQIDAMAHHARLTTMGEVASTLAHELNQPLTAIVSYSAGLSMALKKQSGLDPEVLDAMESVRKNAAQAGRIVHRIRTRLSRRDPVPEACDLNAVVQDALDLLARRLTQTSIRLDAQLAPDLPLLQADRVGIEQVITNLVRNAADSLGAAAPERNIRVATELRSGAVRVEVSDNGPGLQGRTIEALCASFYSTKPEGMGMGLAICRSIIEAHQGSLGASEAAGGGASFFFSLPITETLPTRTPA